MKDLYSDSILTKALEKILCNLIANSEEAVQEKQIWLETYKRRGDFEDAILCVQSLRSLNSDIRQARRILVQLFPENYSNGLDASHM